MHRILFHIPTEIWGIPVFGPIVDGSVTSGPSLLLGVWLVLSIGLMAWLVWRQGLQGDTWGHLPMLLLVGAIIWWVLPAVCDAHGFPIRGYGAMLLVASLSGVGLLLWRARRVGIDSDLILSLAFWMFLPGIVCTRAFYVIEYWSTQYYPVYQTSGLKALVIAVVNFTQGGVVAFGGFIGGMIGLLLFVRKYRQPLLAMCDLLAPPIMLGLALGRIGCLLNGCCFGGTCDLPWAISFPAGDWPWSPPYIAQIERGQLWPAEFGFRLGDDPGAAPVVESVDPQSAVGKEGLRNGDRLLGVGGIAVHTNAEARMTLWSLMQEKEPVTLAVDLRAPIEVPPLVLPFHSHPVHPTQVYSTINALLLCLLLLAVDRLARRDGAVFALMITIYPIGRFLLEILRTDENAIFGTGLTISQNVSLVLLIVAMAMWVYILRQPPGRAFAARPPSDAT